MPQLTDFQPDAASPFSLADQLADCLRKAIHDGDLRRGEHLPAAGDFQRVSRITVLQAYRQLQSEGLIRMRRGVGSVVIGATPPQYCGVILCGNLRDAPEVFFLSSLQNALYAQISAAGMQARIYTVDVQPDESEGELESQVPDGLRQDIDAGLLRGAFVLATDLAARPALVAWLRRRHVLAVSVFARCDLPTVRIDHWGMLQNGLRYLRAMGVRQVDLYSTVGDLLDNPRKQETALAQAAPDLHLRIEPWTINRDTALHLGREAVRRARTEETQLPRAIFCTDDWMGLGCLMELLRQGVRVPEDVRLLVACNRGQIADALVGCDRMVLDLSRVAEMAVCFLENQISGESTPGDLLVQHELVPHSDSVATV